MIAGGRKASQCAALSSMAGLSRRIIARPLLVEEVSVTGTLYPRVISNIHSGSRGQKEHYIFLFTLPELEPLFSLLLSLPPFPCVSLCFLVPLAWDLSC